MGADEFSQRHAEAVAQFNHWLHRSDGLRVTSSLCAGLSLLRDTMVVRLHEDVERAVGRDSMLVPVSEVKACKAARREIDLYQAVESAVVAREFGYVESIDWYLNWLCRLRQTDSPIDPIASARLAEYLEAPADQRRVRFEGVLSKVLPESTRAPLVLFRLFPLAVEIATAQAFADHSRAARIRRSQASILPAILDCRDCHGKVLENGEQCAGCGNPLWKFTWLTAD